MSDVTRRDIIVGSATALTAAVLGARPAAATDAPKPPPHVEVHPVTSDRVAVVARIPAGQELTVRQGSQVRRQKASAGVAVLGIAVTKDATSRVTVEVPGSTRTVGVDTRIDALRASMLRIVNKRIALSRDDAPAELIQAGGVMLDKRLDKPFAEMIAAAREDKIGLEAVSGYRSFEYQQNVYSAYEKRDGRAAADRYSARPGHSEHQLGLTLDVRGADGLHELAAAFKDTPTGRWVAAHAHEFGFVVRYPQKQEKVTGYQPEPWHLRFVGADVAHFLDARRDIPTLEGLFGLPDAPGY